MNYKIGREKMSRKNHFVPIENCLEHSFSILAQYSHPGSYPPLTCFQFVCTDDICQSSGVFGTVLGKAWLQGLLRSSDTRIVQAFISQHGICGDAGKANLKMLSYSYMAIYQNGKIHRLYHHTTL